MEVLAWTSTVVILSSYTIGQVSDEAWLWLQQGLFRGSPRNQPRGRLSNTSRPNIVGILELLQPDIIITQERSGAIMISTLRSNETLAAKICRYEIYCPDGTKGWETNGEGIKNNKVEHGGNINRLDDERIKSAYLQQKRQQDSGNKDFRPKKTI